MPSGLLLPSFQVFICSHGNQPLFRFIAIDDFLHPSTREAEHCFALVLQGQDLHSMGFRGDLTGIVISSEITVYYSAKFNILMVGVGSWIVCSKEVAKSRRISRRVTR